VFQVFEFARRRLRKSQQTPVSVYVSTGYLRNVQGCPNKARTQHTTMATQYPMGAESRWLYRTAIANRLQRDKPATPLSLTVGDFK